MVGAAADDDEDNDTPGGSGDHSIASPSFNHHPQHAAYMLPRSADEGILQSVFWKWMVLGNDNKDKDGAAPSSACR